MSGWTTYDEYGNATRLAPAAVGNTYRWHGADQRAVAGAGLILMGARLYNPATGQFTTRDPVPGGNSTTYAYPQDPVNGEDLEGLAVRYGGLYILYQNGRPVYVGQSVNLRSRVLTHLRSSRFRGVTRVAFKRMPRYRNESYYSYKRRLAREERRVINSLRARGYELKNRINAHRGGSDLGRSNLRGSRSASKSQITARPSGAGGLGNISFGPMPPLRGGHAGFRQK
ncbi:RHS repeat-associated core domain-containing protein [Micrococcus endophyticus]